jgi:hypothetical protein
MTGKSVETYRPRPRAELDRTSRHRPRVSIDLKAARQSAMRYSFSKSQFGKAKKNIDVRDIEVEWDRQSEAKRT